MKVLVTGASGRLGPFVVRELENHGHEVVLFSRGDLSDVYPTNRRASGDITSFDDCMAAVDESIDAIHHLAAQPWPTDHPGMQENRKKQGVDFDATMRSNIMGTYYLLQAAVQKGVKIFVMTGSNCALGHGFRISDEPFPFSYLPVDEDHRSYVEDSYSYSKFVGEELLFSYSRGYGIKTYSLRAAGISNEARRKEIRQNAKPAAGWNPWLWAWVGSEDVASAHRILMEKSGQIPSMGAFYCNADDTTAAEPSRELVERFQPNLLNITRPIDGHGTLISNLRLRAIGWQHATSWR